MNYNFKKFYKEKTNNHRYKGGLTITRGTAFLLEKTFPLYKRIDIYVDYEKNAIKIIQGSSYALSLVTRGKSGKYPSFSCRALVSNGIKEGHYQYIGEGIFILTPNKKVN